MAPSPADGPTTVWTPGVDYRATSRRQPYAELSPAVRATVDELVGSRVVAAGLPVTSGFTSAYAGAVRTADGQRYFVKASGPQFPIPVAALRREAEVLRTLGAVMPSVPLVAAGPTPDAGAVVVLQWVEGHLPGFPWTDDDVDLVHRACLDMAAVPGQAVAGLGPGRLHTDFVGPELQTSLDQGLPLPTDGSRLPAWLPQRLDDLAGIAGTYAVLVGDHVNHHDLRPDNLLVGRLDGAGETRVFVLDWNWLTLGPAWCDWVGLVPTMSDQGRDLRRLLASPLCDTASKEQLAAWFAVVAAYMLRTLDHPPHPGTTIALRQHQRYYAHIFLDALAALLGWT